MHKPLPDPLQFGAPGVVPGGVQGKEREHAAVPVLIALSGLAVNFILKIETPAGGTRVGTGAAVEAGKGDLFPERGPVQVQNVLIFQTARGDGGGDFGFCRLLFPVEKGGVFINRFQTGGLEERSALLGQNLGRICLPVGI